MSFCGGSMTNLNALAPDMGRPPQPRPGGWRARRTRSMPAASLGFRTASVATEETRSRGGAEEVAPEPPHRIFREFSEPLRLRASSVITPETPTPDTGLAEGTRSRPKNQGMSASLHAPGAL